MAKSKTRYVCGECAATSSKWSGQCGDCGAWNSFTEASGTPSSHRAQLGGYAGGAGNMPPQFLDTVKADEAQRIPSGDLELDRVLGGGLVGGAVILVGGDPGIGKSTLLLQLQAAVSAKLDSLYISGEESLQQIALRARRLGLDSSRLKAVSATQVESIMAIADREKPAMMVVDSIQTIYSEQVTSAPGSVSQVRESAAALVRYAKSRGTIIILVGHVTKEGGIAGPRVLEHMVDAVLYFEGDSAGRFRVLRALKNRFGAVNELGIFAMTDQGLKPVSNPSAIFLANQADAPGSVVTVTREGTRPLLVEVQALVADSPLANPRRVGVGFDHSRLALLLAVLSRHGGISMHDQDVFLNAVGGLKLTETATDLPALMAILSSFRNRSCARGWVMFGEIGLAGEVRPVYNGEERLREAAKHGLKQALVPRANVPKRPMEGLKVIGVADVHEALEQGPLA